MGNLTITGLGPVALGLLTKRYPVRRPPVVAAELEKLLAKAKVSGHAPARAFERAYGGLSFPERGEGRGWRKAGALPWLVGPADCLSSEDSFHPPGKKKLVPVVCTANDVVYFIDTDGAGWSQDTIEDARPVLIAPDARAMMSRILFWEEVVSCPDDKKLELPSARGKAAAAALKLRAIADASDDTERWWSDGKTFVVERAGKRGAAQTTIAHAPKGALAKLGIEGADQARAPQAAPVTFDSVRAEHAPVLLVRDVPGKMKAIYPAFFEASRHAQPCVIELRVGGAVSFAKGALSGVISAIDDTNPGAALRVQLTLTGNPAFAKKPSRVEIFFRDYGSSTMMNIYEFDVKGRQAEAIREVWSKEVLDRWRPRG